MINKAELSKEIQTRLMELRAEVKSIYKTIDDNIETMEQNGLVEYNEEVCEDTMIPSIEYNVGVVNGSRGGQDISSFEHYTDEISMSVVKQFKDMVEVLKSNPTTDIQDVYKMFKDGKTEAVKSEIDVVINMLLDIDGEVIDLNAFDFTTVDLESGGNLLELVYNGDDGITEYVEDSFIRFAMRKKSWINNFVYENGYNETDVYISDVEYIN